MSSLPPSPGAPADPPRAQAHPGADRGPGPDQPAGLDALRRLVGGPARGPSVVDRVGQRLAAVGLPTGRGRLAGLALAAVVVVAVALALARAGDQPGAAGPVLPMASRGGSRAPGASAPGSTAGVPRQVLDDPGGPTTTGAAGWAAVAGAVLRPGLYPIGADTRVSTLIGLAGDLTTDADPDRINLAAIVHDGERVYVPHRGDLGAPPIIAGADAAGSGGPARPGSGSGSASGPVGAPPGGAGPPSPGGRLDVNAASAEELDRLPGVGPATAAAIIQYRSTHGPFASVEDLGSVRGIGPAKLEQLRDLVKV
jgi:competence protein ComEA